MDEVVDFERDFRRVKQGDSLIYTTLLGIKSDLSQPRIVPDILDTPEVDVTVATEQNDCDDTSDNDRSDDETECNSEDIDGDDDEETAVGNKEDDPNKKEKFKHPERQRDESPTSRRVRLCLQHWLVGQLLFYLTVFIRKESMQ